MPSYYAPAADLSTQKRGSSARFFSETLFPNGGALWYNAGMNTVIELYSPAALARLNRRNRIWAFVLAALVCAALVACVLLCARVDTLNARAMLARIIAVSTLGGWLVIALWWNVVLPGRREAAHESHMLTGERETDTGELTVSRELQIIPKSAPLLRAALRGGARVRRLAVSPKKAALLPDTPRRVRVWTVYGCIVAWEACDETD